MKTSPRANFISQHNIKGSWSDRLIWNIFHYQFPYGLVVYFHGLGRSPEQTAKRSAWKYHISFRQIFLIKSLIHFFLFYFPSEFYLIDNTEFLQTYFISYGKNNKVKMNTEVPDSICPRKPTKANSSARDSHPVHLADDLIHCGSEASKLPCNTEVYRVSQRMGLAAGHSPAILCAFREESRAKGNRTVRAFLCWGDHNQVHPLFFSLQRVTALCAAFSL